MHDLILSKWTRSIVRSLDYCHFDACARELDKCTHPVGHEHRGAATMLGYFEETTWLSADTQPLRKPVPESVRLLVRDRARNAWK